MSNGPYGLGCSGWMSIHRYQKTMGEGKRNGSQHEGRIKKYVYFVVGNSQELWTTGLFNPRFPGGYILPRPPPAIGCVQCKLRLVELSKRFWNEWLLASLSWKSERLDEKLRRFSAYKFIFLKSLVFDPRFLLCVSSGREYRKIQAYLTSSKGCEGLDDILASSLQNQWWEAFIYSSQIWMIIKQGIRKCIQEVVLWPKLQENHAYFSRNIKASPRIPTPRPLANQI